jgi:transposase
MSFIRKIKKSSGTYLARIENIREGGRVKQKVIEYLGKEVKGKPVKRIRSDKINITSVKQYLDIVVIDKIARELKLHELLGKYSRQILILVYSHLIERISINKLPDWLEQTDMLAILEIDGISSKELYEALDHMNRIDIRVIEREINKEWKNYEDIEKLLVLDITDTYFNGSTVDWKSRRGKDGKYDKLIQVALAVSFKNGFPLFHKMYEGNINNVKIFQDMLSDIKSMGYEGIILDRGMYSRENLEEIEAMKFKAIVGARLHSGFQKEYIDKIEREEIYSKINQVELKDTYVYVKSFDFMQGRLIVVYNPAIEVMKREHHYAKDKPQELAKYLGYSLIYHNTELTDKEAVIKYYEKDIIEKSFRQLKGILSLRPIRVWLMHHVEAHIKICYLSYCILSLLSYKLKPLKLSSIEGLEKLKTAYKVNLEDKSTNFKWQKIVTLTKIQQKILKLLNVVYKI